MFTPRYAIPTVSALGVLATTSGCTDPVVGTWDLTQVTYDGDTIDIPLEVDGETLTGGASFSKKEQSTIWMTYTSGSYSQTYTYNVTVNDQIRGAWAISADMDGYTFEADCVAVKDELTCTGTIDGTPMSLAYTRASE